MKLWKALVHRIRLWDIGWNPFYSPSLAFLENSLTFGEAFKKAYEAATQETKYEHPS